MYNVFNMLWFDIGRSKRGEIRMPNALIDLGFCSYKSTYFGENVTT